MFNFSNKINSKFNPIIIIIIVILLVSAGLFYFFNLNSKNGVESREFAGRVDNIENNLIYVSGSFVSLEHPELGKVGNNVTIDINAGTKFRRTVLYLPPKEELEKTGGAFNPKDLERKVEEVSFDKLAEDYSNKNDYIGGVTIYAKTEVNIYGMDKFRASEIEYIVAMRPINNKNDR